MSSLEAENVDMDEDNIAETVESDESLDDFDTDTVTVATLSTVMNAKTGLSWAVPRPLVTALNPTQDLQSRRQAMRAGSWT